MLVVDFAIGEGCGHSTQQGEEAQEPNQAPNNGSDGGCNSRIRFAQDNSPEKIQEEKPIRIEAATRMRQEALEEHGAIIRALNHLRIYNVPSRLHPWYRDKSSTSIPLDHTEPEESGAIAVNCVVDSNGALIWAPEKGEEDDDDFDDDDEDDALLGSAAQSGQAQLQNGQTQNAQTQAAVQAQAAPIPSYPTQGSLAQHSHTQHPLASGSQTTISHAQNAPAPNTPVQNVQAQHEQSQNNDSEQLSESEENAQEQVSEQLYTEQLHAAQLHSQAQLRGGLRGGGSQPTVLAERPENEEHRGAETRARKRQPLDEGEESCAKIRRWK